MRFYWLTLGALAVWRLTHLVAAEDGPFALVARLRRCAGAGFWGSLLDCFYCLSLWVSAPFAGLLGDGWKERIFLWLALSGAAVLLERATGRTSPPPAVYFEEQEPNDAVLWKQKNAAGRGAAQ